MIDLVKTDLLRLVSNRIAEIVTLLEEPKMIVRDSHTKKTKYKYTILKTRMKIGKILIILFAKIGIIDTDMTVDADRFVYQNGQQQYINTSYKISIKDPNLLNKVIDTVITESKRIDGEILEGAPLPDPG